MGYATTTEIVSAERAEQIRAMPRPRYIFGPAPSFGSRLLSEAVQHWNDTEAGRYEDARSEEALMHKPVSEHSHRDGFNVDDYGTGTAHIVPIVDPKSVVTATKKVKLTVPGEVADGLRRDYPWDAMQKVRNLLHEQFTPETLGKVEVVSLPAVRKPVAKATDGKAVTRYVITTAEDVYHVSSRIRAAFKEAHESQAAARAAAIELLTEHDTLPALSVEAVVGRMTEDGTFSKELVSIARPVPAEAVITVAVTTHTVKPNPKIDRYEVTFWYHH